MARLVLNPRLKRAAERYRVVERALWRLEALALRLLWAVAASFPVDRASALGAWVGRRLGPRLRKHRHVRQNVALALPDRVPAAVEAAAIAAWGQIGRVLAEYPHLARLCARGPDQRIEAVADPAAEALHRSGRPAIYVAVHQANWNLPAACGHLFGFPLSVVFGRQQNPFLEALIERHRNAMPCGFIDAKAGPRALMAELAAGRSIGMHMDHRFDTGEMVLFFGLEAPTVTIPARLAIKAGIPLIPCQIERLEGARFRITLHAPIYPDLQITDVREAARRMTLKVNRHFEQWIRQNPEQWVCARRRWPREALQQRRAEQPPVHQPSTPRAA